MRIRRRTTSPEVPVKRETLEFILKDKSLSELFQDWAAQNLCSENLLFYREIERYKLIRDPNFLKSEAYRIHAKYVRAKAVAEVNLDYDCRDAIENSLADATPTLFDEAKYFVLDLLKYDLYQKFIDSDIYRDFKGLPSTQRFPISRRRSVNIAEMPHITYEQISSLSKCLSDPLACDEFLKFAYTEFSDAVVQFYLDVEKFEQHPSMEFASTIYTKYLGEASDEEVDADPKIKKQILQQLQLGGSPADLFRHLKLQLYSAMVQDNFMRFQNFIIHAMAVI